MDFVLRCNSLKCRTPLGERAVVTTCSHIFCENCTHSLGLTAAPDGNRICPACQSSLPNPDDAVTTTLNPSEDYKTSVLSGLAPNLIMECAGRGLAFWSYQSTQEIVYQEYLAKTLTEKYNNSRIELDHIVNQANSEIDMLTQRLNRMPYLAMDNERLKNESQVIAANLKERTRKHQQTQELYDRLKRKQMTAATQFAAQSAANESIEDVSWNGHNNLHQAPRGSNGYSAEHTEPERPQRSQRLETHPDQGFVGMMPPPPPPRPGQQAGAAPTPHRAQLGHPGPPGSSRLRNVSNNMPSSSQGTPRQRQPLNRISPNAGALNGYGMSAGLKIGRQSVPRFGNENQAPSGRTALRRSPRITGYTQQGQDGGNTYF